MVQSDVRSGQIWNSAGLFECPLFDFNPSFTEIAQLPLSAHSVEKLQNQQSKSSWQKRIDCKSQMGLFTRRGGKPTSTGSQFRPRSFANKSYLLCIAQEICVHARNLCFSTEPSGLIPDEVERSGAVAANGGFIPHI